MESLTEQEFEDKVKDNLKRMYGWSKIYGFVPTYHAVYLVKGKVREIVQCPIVGEEEGEVTINEKGILAWKWKDENQLNKSVTFT